MTMKNTILLFLLSIFVILTTFNRKAGASLEFIIDNDDDKGDRALTMEPSTKATSDERVNMDTVPNLEDSNDNSNNNLYGNKDDDGAIENSQTEQGSRGLSDAERSASASAVLGSKQEHILEMHKDLLESNRLYLILVCSVISVGCVALSLAIIFLARKIAKLSSEKPDIVAAEEGKYVGTDT
ncbi:hypothetical protein XENTR_v10023658 [Xenopus tropicalis]|nr:hypothetical protein XENTR_v10023658 [Xenopus tropicalis]